MTNAELCRRLREHAKWLISCSCGNISDDAALWLEAADAIEAPAAAIAYIRTRIETGHFRSDYQRGELDACEKIEKAMNGGGE